MMNLPPPAAVFLLLAQDLVGEVPDQKQHIVRRLVQERLRRLDGQLHPGHEPPLLVSAAVGHEIQGFGADAEVVEQDGPLGRRSVGGDGFALALSSARRAKRSFLMPSTRRPKSAWYSKRSRPHSFSRARSSATLSCMGAAPALLGEDAQRAAVHLHPLHPPYLKAVARKKLVQGGEGVVAQMLVVDGVEQAAVHQVLQVRRFDNHGTAGL